jgi:hypothetical protein
VAQQVERVERVLALEEMNILQQQHKTSRRSVPEQERSRQTDELTYCCRAVLQTATTAATRPLALTLTSVTVHTATPASTTAMLSLVSRE